MRDLKPSHVADVMARMDALGLSASYRHVVHKAISGVCEMAVADGLMRANPTRKVKAPRPERSTKVVPTREQVAKMIEEAATEPRARALIVVLAYTGQRISEAHSLWWSDWDGAGTLRVLDTKGHRPRAVPVTATLAEELKAWRKVQTAERVASVWWGEGDYILSTPIGTRWDPSNARKKAFRPVADKVCPGATPHSLRHAAATLLLEEGVPMRVVAELLGHADTRTTAQVYSHVTARLVADAGAAIERALG
jgi:integrase